jgi:RNA polymerase sigma factor (sigma-70 family)
MLDSSAHPSLSTDDPTTSTLTAPRPRDAAWDVLAEYRLAVVRFLQRKCRDIHQAEDLAHDTLIKAVRYGDSLGRVARPGAWLMQIAANVQRDFVRKEVRHRHQPPSDDVFQDILGTEPIPGEVSEANFYEIDGARFAEDDLVAEIRQLWEQMSLKDRTILSGYYREGGSSALAAQNCSIDRNLVKIRLFRARRRLESNLRQRLRCA